MGTDHIHKDTAPTLIGSVQRALRLLEAMYAEGGATAKRLSRLTGIPLPTVYHLLRTLTHEGYVLREGGAFRLSDHLPLAS
ncbi:winged helix-turn-helix transcriptional regulator [Streptomyces sp. WAC06614]|nr:winged helix-turn-helix transcriptional regulator [Streptomyces sp. WAC06614]